MISKIIHNEEHFLIKTTRTKKFKPLFLGFIQLFCCKKIIVLQIKTKIITIKKN